MISRKKEIIIFLVLLFLFIGLRLPGLHSSYHQDEYKWVYLTYQSDILPPGNIPHPPLAEFFFILFGPTLGPDNYRLIPFVFGIVNLFLVFYLAKIIFDKRTALWSVFLCAVVYLSVIASLMVDVDGEFMPMFFLIMMIAYYKLRQKNFSLKGSLPLLIMFAIGAVGGFLVKLSGILPLGAVALDFAIQKGVFKDTKKIIKYFFIGLATLIAAGVIVYLSKYIFTYFSLSKSLVYWKHFGNSSSFLNRGWLQTFIQFWKSVLYASPLLVAPIIFINKEIWKKTRPFFLFIFIGIIFYVLIFDFSLGALDRYFQFFVIPLSIICAAIFSKYMGGDSGKIEKHKIILPAIVAVLIFFLQYLSHATPSMYPKILWLHRIITLKWNFLFPFSGGSGPLPFYVSFLFIAVSWFACLLFFVFYRNSPNAKKLTLTSILILGLVYNGVFIEEYLFGKINGSTQTLVHNAADYIKSNDKIKKVLVYNDNGAFEIQQIGKYQRRIYAVPNYEDTYKKIFADFKGNLLFIDIPKVAEGSLYKKYFDSCTTLYTETSKKITSKIYDCSF